MESIGLIVSVVLLIILAMRGVDIFLSAILCSFLVIFTNDIPLATGITQYFPFGPLGAFTFAGKFFLLFATGAVFGRIMGDSHAAASIALALVDKLGAHRTLWIIVLACSLLTYGGVVVFVVVFTMYPLGVKLLEQSDIPKRLFSGALVLGAGTYTLTALPGTPSIHNVISSVALKTDLFAGAGIGIVGGAMMFVLGMWYLERQRVLAQENGEHFVPGPNDQLASNGLPRSEYPPWQYAILPLALVLLIILIPRIFTMTLSAEMLASEGVLFDVLRFAQSQPIVWPSIGLMCGTLLAIILFYSIHSNALQIAGLGANDSIKPLIHTAAVVGFGSVVTHTSGFQGFTELVLNSDLPPLLSMFFSVNLVSGITGSSSGGLQIFMQTMAPAYLELGIKPEVLHRLATMASGGFDTLPHSGGLIAIFTITGLTHKQAYKDIGVITVVIPVFVTLLMVGLVSIS